MNVKVHNGHISVEIITKKLNFYSVYIASCDFLTLHAVYSALIILALKFTEKFIKKGHSTQNVM